MAILSPATFSTSARWMLTTFAPSATARSNVISMFLSLGGSSSVRRRRPPLDGGDIDRAFGALYSKENTPTAHTPPKPGIALDVFNIAGKWVRFHFVQGGAYAGPVSRRHSLKRLLRGPGEDDAPSFLFGGVHLG
jgi:hypothetical protein